MSFLAPIADLVTRIIPDLLLSPGSRFFIGSLISATLIAAGHLAWRRHKRGRRIRLRTILAALFPLRIWRHRSTRADILILFTNIVLFTLLLGWAAISYFAVSNSVRDGLISAFGPQSPTTLPEYVARSIVTLLLFLAFEFAYWLDHYLMHRIPFLWEFHKVHHSAEHLTPLTVARVHPVDALVYTQIKALVLGITGGVAAYGFGGTVEEYTFSGTNAIMVVFVHLYFHLQHSHIWIAFTGWWGRMLSSPAHHQIHHSTNPKHFNKNLGGCLAVWDWLFGTLWMPARTDEKLTFGIDAQGRDVHEMGEALFGPLRDAAGHLKPGDATPAPKSAN
jgi:sterol desaturase/sphingolipid hydroxylase (fatty acid hydroxylase superfamily)